MKQWKLKSGKPQRLPSWRFQANVKRTASRAAAFWSTRNRPVSYIFAMCGQDGRYAIVCTKAYANDIAQRMRIDVHTQRVGKCFIAAPWISLHGRRAAVSIGRRDYPHTRHAARIVAPKRATAVNKCAREHTREACNSTCISVPRWPYNRKSIFLIEPAWISSYRFQPNKHGN